MFQKNTLRTRTATTLGLVGLAALTAFVAFTLVTKQFIGIPIALLMLFSWGGMFLLQFMLPFIAVVQIAMWLNRKFSAQV